jgi:CRISPR-associated protein Cas2
MVREREHLYIVAYDISDPRRWRRVFRLMKGYGKWLQLSVFQCRLGTRRHAEMLQLLDGAIAPRSDRLLVIDVGPAEDVEPKFVSLGERFEVVDRGPMVV